MPIDDGANYYEIRRQASLVMSQSADHPGIVKIHVELARRYALLVDVINPMTAASSLSSFKERRSRVTEETSAEFNDRRANKEKSLAHAAPDSVEGIPHRQLSELHAKEARALGGDAPRNTALAITVIGDNVAMETASGEVILLTPEAAAQTSDRLLAFSRHTGRSKSSK